VIDDYSRFLYGKIFRNIDIEQYDDRDGGSSTIIVSPAIWVFLKILNYVGLVQTNEEKKVNVVWVPFYE